MSKARKRILGILLLAACALIASEAWASWVNGQVLKIQILNRGSGYVDIGTSSNRLWFGSKGCDDIHERQFKLLVSAKERGVTISAHYVLKGSTKCLNNIHFSR